MATHEKQQRVLMEESTSCTSQAAARRLQDQMVSRGACKRIMHSNVLVMKIVARTVRKGETS